MNIGIYGKNLSENFGASMMLLLQKLEMAGCGIHVYEPFGNLIKRKTKFKTEMIPFAGYSDIKGKLDLLISIGGDGSMLNAMTMVRDSGIPVLGVNTGRLGFLSSIAQEHVPEAIDLVLQRRYVLEERSLLKVETSDNMFGELNFALNEVTVMKKDVSSMISISAWVNNEFLNTYWADGLIVATPTGSTAYSLSCGGPIITPESNNFIITPVATHNLTVRPIVIPDKYTIRLQIGDGRNRRFLVSLDSRTHTIDHSIELNIALAGFRVKLVRLQEEEFFSTIRSKLMWGQDKRN